MLAWLLLLARCRPQWTKRMPKPRANATLYPSQGGQEVFALQRFATPGTYIEIGCNDGYSDSNTYALYKLGWRGVCLEADPAKFAEIPQKSGRTDAENFAVAGSTATIKTRARIGKCGHVTWSSRFSRVRRYDPFCSGRLTMMPKTSAEPQPLRARHGL